MKPVFEKIERRSDPRFKIFHELMRRKVREILFISSPYDAWVMEKDRGLSEAIVHEYRGLNLSHPPRLNWVASVEEASLALKEQTFDLVIIMTQAHDPLYLKVIQQIKRISPATHIVRLYHKTPGQLISLPDDNIPSSPDRTLVWSGDTKLLLAIIKSIEDQLNVTRDTHLAAIRVIIFVEDSPEYLSSLLPFFYQELVSQTQAIMEEGLNEEHRMLAMRARPKILLASSFEAAIDLFEKFEPYVLGVISDVRFPHQDHIIDEAGVELLKIIHKRRFDIPLLLTSSEPENSKKAKSIPAVFVDKNSTTLHKQIRSFFLTKLGFGEFVFRGKDGRQTLAASNLHSLETGLRDLPGSIFYKHWLNNDFSRWLFARAETMLATEIREVTASDFDHDLGKMRQYLYQKIHIRRLRRQRGVLVDFEKYGYDPDTEFFKIGDGSLGGKARGLAFFNSWLYQQQTERLGFENVDIYIPQTLVVNTDCYESFIKANQLGSLIKEDLSDDVIANAFSNSTFPVKIREQLRIYLEHVQYPLAVRSSSLLEDAKFRAYAGLYKTFMLANDSEDLDSRLEQLINAIKMVYASTYYQEPKAFSRRVGNRIEEEKMAVIIQQVVGERYDDFYYPTLSGVAQSHNYYPFPGLRPEDGAAVVALGLGKVVMGGEKSLRFSPRHPEIIPQFSNVGAILDSSQRYFYALKMDTTSNQLGLDETVTLVKREISEAAHEHPINAVSSTYDAAEHRIRETAGGPGVPVITFSSILKYNSAPLSQILHQLLEVGEEGLGCPVEIEFSMILPAKHSENIKFAILQIRPMGAHEDLMTIDIENYDTSSCFCISHQALGNTINDTMQDIIYVKPDSFNPTKTIEIASEIASLNADFCQAERRYILIGPGRWGSADRWLGIPVNWGDIRGVGAIIEAYHPLINAEPSQGSHFFHNITSLGINYLTISKKRKDYLDWKWINELRVEHESDLIAHVRGPRPFTLKVDGRQGKGVLFK